MMNLNRSKRLNKYASMITLMIIIVSYISVASAQTRYNAIENGSFDYGLDYWQSEPAIGGIWQDDIVNRYDASSGAYMQQVNGITSAKLNTAVKLWAGTFKLSAAFMVKSGATGNTSIVATINGSIVASCTADMNIKSSWQICNSSEFTLNSPIDGVVTINGITNVTYDAIKLDTTSIQPTVTPVPTNTPSQTQSGGQLSNPGFDTYKDAWHDLADVNTYEWPYIFQSNEAIYRRSGTLGVGIGGSGGNGLGQRVTVVQGQSYIYGIYAKSYQSSNRIRIIVNNSDDYSATAIAIQDCIDIPNSTFTQCGGTFTANTTIALRFWIEGYGVAIDDAYFIGESGATPTVTPTHTPTVTPGGPTLTPVPTMTATRTPLPTIAPTVNTLPTPTTFVPPIVGEDGNKPCALSMQIALERIKQGLAYCWGANDPSIFVRDSLCPSGYGLDCSGLGVWSYRQAGVNMPDDTAQGMYNRYHKVSGSLNGSGLAIGDAIVIGSSATTIKHIAWYAGGGYFNDCFNTGTGCITHRIDNSSAYINAGFRGYIRPSVTLGLPQCTNSDFIGGNPPADGSPIGGQPSGGSPGGSVWIPGYSEMNNPPVGNPASYTQTESERSLLPEELSQADDGWTASMRASMYDFGCPIDMSSWGLNAKLCIKYQYLQSFMIMGMTIRLDALFAVFLVAILIGIIIKR